MRLHLVDSDPAVVAAWEEGFRAFPEVVIRQGNILAVAENMLVLPANAVGLLGGGVDAVYAEYFGPGLEEKVKAAAARQSWDGRPFLLETGHPRIRLLLMVPAKLSAGPAIRGVLELAASVHIDGPVFCPGLATSGDAPPPLGAGEMARAYKGWKEATERRWQETKQNFDLLNILEAQEDISDRKWRLFACASVRSIWHLIQEPLSRRTVELAEWYADGRIAWEEAARVSDAATRLAWPSQLGYAPYTADYVASQAFIRRLGRDCRRRARWVSGMVWQVIMASGSGYSDAGWAERNEYDCGIIRDIFGNPLQPETQLDSSLLIWNGGAVVNLAQTIYDERRFGNMPLLGELLEQAGCRDESVLNHCRQHTTSHFSGCWLIDRLLGQE